MRKLNSELWCVEEKTREKNVHINDSGRHLENVASFPKCVPAQY